MQEPGMMGHTPLAQVRFCVVDLETTGLSAQDCRIIEVAALRSVGGEIEGRLHSLVRPDGQVPESVQTLTGITPRKVQDAPTLQEVLPCLVEFVRGCVLVAHNARFDTAFLHAACARLHYELPIDGVLDTVRLARILLDDDEVPDARLATLARRARIQAVPIHRAMPDAAACLEILHYLIERAATYGVDTIESLRTLSGNRFRAALPVVRLAASALPTRAGVWVLRSACGDLLEAGWSGLDTRREAIMTFLTADGRAIRSALRNAAVVEGVACADDSSARREAERIRATAPSPRRRRARPRNPDARVQ